MMNIQRENHKREYQLSITVTRHGPKRDFDGPLTDEGKRFIEKHYLALFPDIPSDASVPRKIITSPSLRAISTAEIYQRVLFEQFSVPILPMEQEERLGEKKPAEFKQLLSESKRNDWFRFWYSASVRPQPDVFIGREVVAEFTNWLLEQISIYRDNNSPLKIYAFTHGPVMAAFILRLEKLLGMDILIAPNNDEQRLDFDKLFTRSTSEFNYLQSFSLDISFAQPGTMMLSIAGKTVTIPISVLNQLLTS